MDKPEAGPATGDPKLDALVAKYLELERSVPNKQHIQQLLELGRLHELHRLLATRLTFGTAGIRGAMGPGLSQMNDLVVIQTSQGLASYLLAAQPAQEVRGRGVVIGFDGRHNSRRFAQLAALAFLQHQVPVHFCDHIVATPLVAFGVRHLNCVAGIMVTASHNPKGDNGYKVYGANGAQILSPVDKRIQDSIMLDANQEPWSRAWQPELLETSLMPSEWAPLFRQVYGELTKSYFGFLETLVDGRRVQNSQAAISITYTSLHGVGHHFLTRAFDLAGFDEVFAVEPQKAPDPDFSTVRYPNPEESGALELAFDTARHANSTLILANDPDADRCGAALYEPSTGRRRVLTGNELGTLLGWWAWQCHVTGGWALRDSEAAAAPERPADAADCVMISSTVSSKILESMARREGFHFEETLTGFKYMGNLADELRTSGKKVLFAFEEAIGYMVSAEILDKDGISAALQVAQCAAYVALRYSRTLEQHLDALYIRYGYHYNLNSYYICRKAAQIRQIFLKIQANYPTHFSCATGNFRVARVRDLNSGYDSAAPDRRATLPTSSGSYMVSFFVDDDISLTIRTSGTEPKVKYYSEIVAQFPAQVLDEPDHQRRLDQMEAIKERARNRLAQLVEAALQVCLAPEENRLESAA